MRGVTGFDLARMRVNADQHATSNIHVYRRTPVSDGRGGQTETLARQATYLGRKAPLTTVQATEQSIADRLGGNQGWWLTLPKDADVRMNDRLVSSERNFEVVGFDSDRGEAVSTRVLGRELT